MTINYNLAVSTSKPWTLFKLLLKWRGSIWKAVILELTVWLILYAVLSIIYRTALNPNQQRTFERIVEYCDSRLDYIPLNFMLGFFVTAVVNRWTTLYQIIGFIDNIGLMAAEYVRGRSDTARMYRRNIVRYCELAQVLVFRDISMRTRRRFPTLETVVAAGFMMPHEKERYDEIQYRYSKYWLPFQWAFSLTYDARKKGFIESDYYQVVVQDEIKKFRTGLAWLCNYDWVPIPIMYPQLVCLAVHTYFLVCLLARQYVISEHNEKHSEIDFYFPVMSVLQFIFYMGWMKVAEVMLNPFGEDDDDFECNALIDRNITMVLMMVDQGYDRPPDLKKDPFWGEEVEPLYSEETANLPNNPLKGSVSEVKLPETHEVRMMPHKDDRDLLIDDASTSPQMRRRVSIVPVRQQEMRQSRTSVGSIEMFKSFKHKLERSFSRGQLENDVPRKTFSSGNLQYDPPTVPSQKKSSYSAASTPMQDKSFSNNAFVENHDDDVSQDMRKAGSQANMHSAHDFPHHVLDDVMEETEEEVSISGRRLRATPSPLPDAIAAPSLQNTAVPARAGSFLQFLGAAAPATLQNAGAATGASPQNPQNAPPARRHLSLAERRQNRAPPLSLCLSRTVDDENELNGRLEEDVEAMAQIEVASPKEWTQHVTDETSRI